MKPNHRAFVALTREPFGSDLAPKKIMQIAEVLGVAKRFEYAIRLGALALVAGDVGSGKSTAWRWAASRPHPSGVPDHLGHRLTGLHPGTLQANLHRARSGHRQLLQGCPHQAHQKTGPGDRAQDRKKKPVLIINKASLLKLQALAELHTVTQFQGDSKPILPIILAGQNNVADLLNIQSLPAPGLQGRGQRPSGRRLPPEHAGLPPAPPQNRRR
ncbi:hypothetical protein DFAR_1800015 [Desulfarculales bacterium]